MSIFTRITILGTGLIGGSFALAARRHLPAAQFTGWDRPEILDQALARGAIDTTAPDLGRALATAHLVYLALPLGPAIELLPEIARSTSPGALVTDTCSTKLDVCFSAHKYFSDKVRFLGGHPLAGKETGGIDSADADLFHDAPYALVADSTDPDPRVQSLAALVRGIGASPVWLEAETHDRAVAFTSHLPQLLAIALAELFQDESRGQSQLPNLAGSGLRDSLRLAGSPYSVWRDICLTNRMNMDEAIARFGLVLERLRERLATNDLQGDFARANEVYKLLTNLK